MKGQLSFLNSLVWNLIIQFQPDSSPYCKTVNQTLTGSHKVCASPAMPASLESRQTNQPGITGVQVEVESFSKKRPLQWSWSCTEAASIICAPKKRKRQMAIALGILLQWERPKSEFDVNWAGEISRDFVDWKMLKSCKGWWTQISTLHLALQFLTISALQIIETVRFPAQPLYF